MSIADVERIVRVYRGSLRSDGDSKIRNLGTSVVVLDDFGEGQPAAEETTVGRSGRSTVSNGKALHIGKGRSRQRGVKDCVKCQETCMDDITRIQRYFARKKHGRPPWRVICAKYRHQDPKGRVNFVCHLDDGSPIWLYRMSDRPIRRYWVNWHRPTYAEGGISTDIEDHPDSLIEPVSYPAKEPDQMRLIALRRDSYICQHCRATKTNLRVHHIVPKGEGGTDDLDNLITLCHQCHCTVHKSRRIESCADC